MIPGASAAGRADTTERRHSPVDAETADALGLDGTETFEITGIAGGLRPGQRLQVAARRTGGGEIAFDVIARLDTPIDVEYYRHGGILPFVTRKLVRDSLPAVVEGFDTAVP